VIRQPLPQIGSEDFERYVEQSLPFSVKLRADN
jgi:hypothetical protein